MSLDKNTILTNSGRHQAESPAQWNEVASDMLESAVELLSRHARSCFWISAGVLGTAASASSLSRLADLSSRALLCRSNSGKSNLRLPSSVNGKKLLSCGETRVIDEAAEGIADRIGRADISGHVAIIAL